MIGALLALAVSDLLPAGEVFLHVAAPLNNNSTGFAGGEGDIGSAANPFCSVAAARDRLRALQPLPDGGATVILHGGSHQSFVLEGALDSGRAGAPIVYTAAPGEPASVTGAVPIPPAAFKAWDGGTAGVLVAELGPLGITKGMLGGMQYDGSMSFGSCQHDKAELFWGGEAMTLARYPNKAADGSWRFLYADEAGVFGAASPGQGSNGGTWFLMKLGPNATKIKSWITENAAASWLHGYWCVLALLGWHGCCCCTRTCCCQTNRASYLPGNLTGQIRTESSTAWSRSLSQGRRRRRLGTPRRPVPHRARTRHTITISRSSRTVGKPRPACRL